MLGSTVLGLHIGPVTFPLEFQVIDIPSRFNFLLGRAWIHKVWALPSSFHQNIKFPYKGKTIVIDGDT